MTETQIQEKFFEDLHRGGGWVLWWTKEKKESVWFPASEPIDSPNGKVDVWFSVNACKRIPETNSRGEVKEAKYVRTQTDHIQQVNALFADFDFKDFDNDRERTRLAVKEVPLRPSYVVSSGGGFQVYWLFKEPWRMTDEIDIERARDLQSRWVEFIGADEGAKDLARILRLPGSRNYKYTPAREVEIIHSTDNEYDRGDFQRAMAVAWDPEKQSDPIEAVELEETQEFARALMYVNSLKDERREDYQSWLEVGMALRGLNEVGLNIWDSWSKKSSKYKLGDCAAKWRTLKPNVGISLESLKFWARKDNPEGIFDIPGAPKKALPSDYQMAMKVAGWDFAMNEANLDIELNGIMISEPIRAILNCTLQEHSYVSRKMAEECWLKLAYENSYHPVLQYLDRLEWDGQDHIEKLAGFFDDKNGVFWQWLVRWMIGAIARISAEPRGQQNRMLVLDGPQNLGKSYFVRWLATDVPDLHMEGPINPEDKDDSIRLMSSWIWEVAELGSTFRKADREALKFFVSKEKIKIRKPYDRSDTSRPAMSSFVGTVNNESGFLSDPTGSRRFMVVTLTSIDWAYAKEIDPSQLWAQAYHLFRSGEAWELDEQEAKMAASYNAEYEIENPIEDYIRRYYEIDQVQREWFTPTTQILDVLRRNGHLQGSDRSNAMHVGSALKKWGCEKERRRSGEAQQMGWVGVRIRPDPQL